MSGLWLIAMLCGTPQWANVHIRNNLERSVSTALAKRGPAVAAEVARLLRWRGDINRSLHRGDSLSLLYEMPQPPSSAEPTLLALRYNGLQVRLRAYLYSGPDGVARYYDENGALIEPVLLASPVPNYTQITEIVQRGRGRRRHAGIDLKAPLGTPVVLPFAARVRRTNWSRRANGLCVEVTYAQGGVARFLHLAQVLPEVRRGASLPAGTPLGAVGNTGHSNAAHLHYEILRHGRPIEPLDVHGRGTYALPPSSQPAFISLRDGFDRALLGPSQATARLPL